MIDRPDAIFRVTEALRRQPVATLHGPRQCGKTTIARMIAGRGPCEYFDLEKPVDVQLLSQPMLALEGLRGLVIIDEVQRQPGLMPWMKKFR